MRMVFCADKFEGLDASKRLLIAISGIPGSGVWPILRHFGNIELCRLKVTYEAPLL